jgi:molybdopterin-guanine dinucleotide biosynthesis protein A
MSAACAAAILAGGRARRFGGRDKSRLVIEGRTIIVRQTEVLQRVAAPVFIVAPDAGRFADLALPVYPDVVPAGAMGGLATALERAPVDRVLVVGCDLPHLDARLLAALADRAGGADGAWVRSRHGIEPLVACYRRRARFVVRSEILAGRLSLAGLERVLRIRTIEPTELDAFGDAARLVANLNTPADYERLQ